MSNLAALQSSKIKEIHFQYSSMEICFSSLNFLKVLKFAGIIGWIGQQHSGYLKSVIKVTAKISPEM